MKIGDKVYLWNDLEEHTGEVISVWDLDRPAETRWFVRWDPKDPPNKIFSYKEDQLRLKE